MSATTPPTPTYRRHAWGLPAGSVRALLAIAVLILMWGLALYTRPGDPGPLYDPEVRLLFVYLQLLIILMLVHFFTAHGHTIGKHVSKHAPLYLPGGFMRILLLAGYVGLAVYEYQTQQKFELPEQAHLLRAAAVLLSAYFLGWVIARIVHLFWGDQPPAPYQDIQAWVALLAVLGLGVIALITLINQQVSQENKVSLEWANTVLAALVGLYFGARS
jgi:hypothetical protein